MTRDDWKAYYALIGVRLRNLPFDDPWEEQEQIDLEAEETLLSDYNLNRSIHDESGSKTAKRNKREQMVELARRDSTAGYEAAITDPTEHLVYNNVVDDPFRNHPALQPPTNLSK